MKRNLILHPFLFAMYGVLAPYAKNISAVGIIGIRSLLVTLFGAVIMVNLVRLAVKARLKAGLISSMAIAFFFLYGYLDALMPSKEVSGFNLNLVLLLGSLASFGCVVYWILYKLRDDLVVSNYLNIVGLILIVFPLVSIVGYSRETTDVKDYASDFQNLIWPAEKLEELDTSQSPSSRKLPDIYFIVLDSYTRADILKEYYHYDNSSFIRALQSCGFYVAEKSHANYNDTVYSLSSTMNMQQIYPALDFLREKAGVGDDEAYVKSMLSQNIEHSQLRSFLAKQGYQMVNFDTGYPNTNIKSAEFYESSPQVSEFNPQAAFEMMLLNSTLGKFYSSLRGKDYVMLQSLFDDHRQRVLYSLTNLPKYAQKDGNYFIFAHILSPHTPYVFGPNGEKREAVDPYTLLDDVTNEPWKPDLYSDQLSYVNKLVLQAIDQILAESDPKPIIILEGDHSSRAINTVNPTKEQIWKFMFPNLNAYYLPGVAVDQVLYPSISPVNSFRIVLNQYFGTHLDLLADESYKIEITQGHKEFVDFCQSYQVCDNSSGN